MNPDPETIDVARSAMARILERSSDKLRFDVRARKQAGMKSEAAFCELLGIAGDPFIRLLEIGGLPEIALDQILNDKGYRLAPSL